MTQHPNRTLGYFEATAIGAGAMIGAGIFILSGVAVKLAGPAALLSLVLAAALQVLFALAYIELAKQNPCTGGGYAYADQYLGPTLGAISGWSYWGAWIIASSFVAKGFGNYLATLVSLPPLASAVALLISLGVVNLFGIVLSGRFQLIVVLCTALLIFGFSVFGALHVELSYMTPFMPYGVSGIGAATLVSFLSLLGWDGIVNAGGEVREPRRTIPKAVISAIMIVVSLYVMLLFVSLGVLPWRELAASGAPIASASKQFLGSAGPIIVTIIIVIALLATANAFILSISRTAVAMSRRNLLPEMFGKHRSVHKTPVLAIVLSVAIQLTFTLTSELDTAVNATAFLYLLSYLLTVAALIRQRWLQKDLALARWRRVLPYFTLAFGVVLLMQTERQGILAAGVWIATGLGLFAIGAIRRLYVRTQAIG